MARYPVSIPAVLRGALGGFVLGLAVGLLVALVDGGAVNPLFFGAVGIALGAGIAGDRPRPEDDQPKGAP